MKKIDNSRLPRRFLRGALGLALALTTLAAQGKTSREIISMSVRDASVAGALRQVNSVVGETIVSYKAQDVAKETKVVNAQIKEATVLMAVNTIIDGTNLRAVDRTSDVLVVPATAAEVPNTTTQAPQSGRVAVTGTVRDAQGNPVSGASVMQVGNTSNGTSTSARGWFSLNVPRNARLTVSFVGFVAQEVRIGEDGEPLSITLQEETTQLDEVVVVGYGTTRKANLTGAVDQVTSKVLEGRPITSVAQGLQGVLPNLNISANTNTGTDGGGASGARMSFNIRGLSGLASGSSASYSSPLFVVDGVQGQDINALNPNDIESISILKDAASSAIYGSNAPYGVVLITTKKGSRNGKPVVSYNTTMGWSSPIHLPEMMNSVDWAKTMNSAKQASSGSDFLTAENMQRIQDYYDGKITTSTVKNPGHSSYTSWASYDQFGQGLSNDNVEWYSQMIKKSSFYQQHNVSLAGGSNGSTYYVGLGYNDKEGLLHYGDDSFKRYSMRANLSSQVTKWFTANFRGSFSSGVSDRPSNTAGGNFMENIAQHWPIIPLKNPDGHWNDQGRVANYLDGGRNVNKDNVGVMTGEFVFTPIKGWNTTFNYSYTSNNITNVNNSLHFTLYDADGRPYFTPAWDTDGFDSYTRGKDNLYRSRIDDTRKTMNLFSEYAFNVGGDHYLKAMGGFTQELVHYYQLTANSGAVTLYNVDIPTFPTAYYTSNSTTVGEPYKQTLATRGVFGRVNYGYKDRYLLELNGRYDGSSRYQKDVRFKLYPGISAGWIVSAENFWSGKLSEVVDYLKVRGSWGQLGEQSGGWYPFYPSLGVTAATSANWYFNGNRYSSISNPGIVNPDLTWITSSTIDIGADIYMLRGRLRGAFDWYSHTSSNVVGPAQELPAVLGAAAPATNNAKLRTRGFELSLEWRDHIQSIGLSYGVRATLADAKTKVLSYPNEKKVLGTWYNGANIGDIWGYETERYYEVGETIDQNVQGNSLGPGTNWSAGDIKYKDLDGDGLITRGQGTLDDHGDRKVIGNSLPRYTFGLTLDAAWKGFDIMAFFQGVGKRDAWIATSGPGQFWGMTNSEWQANLLTINNDRWTPETPNGYYPKYYMDGGNNGKNQQMQTKYLQNAAYLRFKTLQIGYTLPQAWLQKVQISKLRVFVSFENLCTITKFVKTIDPEFAGLDRGLGYPLQRISSFGVNVTF